MKEITIHQLKQLPKEDYQLIDIRDEGTYLVWLDFKGTGIDATKLDDLMINKARLWLDSGSIFGKTGAGFQRINVACPNPCASSRNV